MALSFITIPENNLGKGIDARSPENSIPAGHVQDAVNVDTVENRLVKRTGYQGYAGCLPVRVRELQYNTGISNNVTFILDESLDLSTLRSTPLVAFGRTSTRYNSSSLGRYPSSGGDAANYYSSFTADIRETLISDGAPHTLVMPAASHGFATNKIAVEFVESTSLSDLSWGRMIPDGVSIDQASRNVSIDYTTSTAASALVWFADKTSVSGSVFSTGNTACPSGSTTVITTTAATHGLSTFNILPEIFQDTGTANVRLKPDSVIIEPDGDVTVTITNNSGSSINVFVVLTAVAGAQVVTGNVAASSTGTLEINNPTTPFVFVACYLESTVGGDKELVIPDSVVYDAATDEITITFTNNDIVGKNVELYYEYGTAVVNEITVTDAMTVASSFIDSRPQLTLWGLCHDFLYGAEGRQEHEGWVTHLDVYRSQTEQRLVAGLGGNLFTARENAEVTNDYLLPTLYSNLRGRVTGDIILAPAFHETSDTPARTRGYITSTGGGDNFVTITGAVYNSSTGFVDYTLSLPAMAFFDAAGGSLALSTANLGTIISDATGLEDWLTADQMGFERLNGAFKIRDVAVLTSTTIKISVENDDIDASDWNDTGAGGTAGVFTDQISLLSTSPFIADDRLLSSSIPESQLLTVFSSSGSTIITDGIVDVLPLGNGTRLTGRRTSRILPLRDSTGTATTTNLVVGDMLEETDLDRELEIISINPANDDTVSVTGDGSTATVTGVSSTALFAVGRRVLLVNAGDFSGTATIATIESSTSFTFESTASGIAASAILVGETVELDEELTWEDPTDNSSTFTVSRRWIPIEAPDDSWNLTPNTIVTHLSGSEYGNQPFLRSTIVGNNLYFSNGTDEVLKFDGTNLYRAGLWRWQPGLFLTRDTGVSAKIDVDSPTATLASPFFEQNRFTVSTGHTSSFAVGNRVESSIDNTKYTITAVDDANNIITVNKLITGAAGAGTLTRLTAFRYYFRLNAVDANNNVIASAVTGLNDFRIELSVDAAVRIRLVGFPAWGLYDFDRLEIECYRTAANQEAPFRKIVTKTLEFDSDNGYIDILDTFADDVLASQSLDTVNTALLGTEVGTTWEEPPRAKFVTSAGNRLILGNIKDYPQLDIRFVPLAGTLVESAFTDSTRRDWLARRDNTDTNTTTDMANRARYVFTSDTALGGTTGTGYYTITGITGSTTYFTATTSIAHGLAVGDWVYLYHAVTISNPSLLFSGWWQIRAVTASTFEVNHDTAGTGAASAFPTRASVATIRTDVPVYMGDDGNLGMVNGNLSTSLISAEIRATRRLAAAINASMRKVDTSIPAFQDFTPWLTAGGGGDFAGGQIVLRTPRVEATTPELLLPSGVGATSSFDVFANNIKRSASSEVGFSTRLLPSRVLFSYPNFPETFDNPFSTLDSDSDSAVDINSADGQEITGIIPFFGESATGSASQLEGIVVVFKTNSIYLLNVQTKQLTKIESQGLGCTAPFSIASTKNGIIFANDSGIYRLNRGLDVIYVGRFMERQWRERVRRDLLEIAHGHHYAVGRRYKLSLPIVGSDRDEEPSEVFVYDHTQEAAGETGSWTRYDNHMALGWANLNVDAFWASAEGRVLVLRQTGEKTDFRDRDEAIAAVVTCRALDFGDTSLRKVVGSVTTSFRIPFSSENTTLAVANDLADDFDETTAFRLINEDEEIDGMGDPARFSIKTIQSTVPRRRCQYFQPRYSNNALDEPMELAGFSMRVAGLSDRGTLQAAQTQEEVG